MPTVSGCPIKIESFVKHTLDLKIHELGKYVFCDGENLNLSLVSI